MLRSLARSESGVTALEYGLAAALIGIAIIVSLLAVGGHLNEDFTYIASSFEPGEEGAGQAPPASGAGGSGAGGSASSGGGSGGSGTQQGGGGGSSGGGTASNGGGDNSGSDGDDSASSGDGGTGTGCFTSLLKGTTA